MTFTEIQDEIAERLNLTSATAKARIGRSINERYRRLASSIGFSTIQQGEISAKTVVGDRRLTFGPAPAVEKLLSVFNPAYTPAQVLDQATFDELRNAPLLTDPPHRYAIEKMGAKSVGIYLDVSPATSYVLSADALLNLTTLAGIAVPAFAEDYHDILIYGGMATEYDKMEKPELSLKKDKEYEDRVSDLRMYIAKSAYLTIMQGKTPTHRTQRLLV